MVWARRLRWSFRTYCKRCRPYTQECGIYLKSGGPPCPYMADLPGPGD